MFGVFGIQPHTYELNNLFLKRKTKFGSHFELQGLHMVTKYIVWDICLFIGQSILACRHPLPKTLPQETLNRYPHIAIKLFPQLQPHYEKIIVLDLCHMMKNKVSWNCKLTLRIPNLYWHSMDSFEVFSIQLQNYIQFILLLH